VIRRFLKYIRAEYVTPFVCFGVLPDDADPNDARHPLHAFGDTPVILRRDIAREVGLACYADVQTTAENGLKAGGTSGAIPANYKERLVDLSKRSLPDKIAHLKNLCSHFGTRKYPEARIYRTITWSDVDDNCRNQLQSQGDGPADVLLGPDIP
jgi:hypothetical protein